MEQNLEYTVLQNEGRHVRTRRKKKTNILRTLFAMVLCGCLLGSSAALSFYGVNRFLSGSTSADNTEEQEESVAAGNQTTGSSGESTSFWGELLPSDGTGAEQTQQQDTTSTIVAENAVQTTTVDTQAETVPVLETVQSGLGIPEIAERTLPGVVSITNISVQEVQYYYRGYGYGFGYGGYGYGGQTQQRETTSCGSGVIFESDNTYLYILTNEHVIENATTLTVSFADGSDYQAELLGYDTNRDLAVIRVPVSNLSAETRNAICVVPIGDSDAMRVGEQVVAIGNALGYGQSVTTGIVSALDRSVSGSEGTYIQTDAAINPGNSGGALLNMQGELVGINSAKLASTEVEGMGYAIPINDAMEIIRGLMR